jgi:hypothetical protein
MSAASKIFRRTKRLRGRPAPAKSSNLAKLAREVGRMSRILDKLVAQRSQRIPLPEYAKVVAVGRAEEVADVRGHVGIVLDSANENGWTYTVYFPAKQETFVLSHNSLWDSGETVPEDVIYGGGQTLRVRVDKDGNGTLVA